MKILVVENESVKTRNIEDVIWKELDREETELVHSGTVNAGLVQLGASRFDLVVVDLVLPQMAGGGACAVSKRCDSLWETVA